MPDSSEEIDRHWMLRALDLARRGQGKVEPNPMVGCVIVQGDLAVASGFHANFGGPHAELAAVQQATANGTLDRLSGATAYVTLEPCCHFGKTPPCSDLLIKVGVSRVVIAMPDPFPAVSGGGIMRLRSAGIRVDCGIQETAARQLNAPYLKRVQTGKPWVIAKWAMSLDGRIATSAGHSQWISGEASRELVHQLRSRVDAIVVGSRTAALDNPMLTARLPNGQPPLRVATRVIVDSQLAVAPESRFAQSADQFPSLIWCQQNINPAKAAILRRMGCAVESFTQPSDEHRLDQLLRLLAEKYQATNVLVEGGGGLLGALFDIKQIDECYVFIAPQIIGGKQAVSPLGGVGLLRVGDGPNCITQEIKACGEDICWRCRLDWKKLTTQRSLESDPGP